MSESYHLLCKSRVRNYDCSLMLVPQYWGEQQIYKCILLWTSEYSWSCTKLSRFTFVMKKTMHSCLHQKAFSKVKKYIHIRITASASVQSLLKRKSRSVKIWQDDPKKVPWFFIQVLSDYKTHTYTVQSLTKSFKIIPFLSRPMKSRQEGDNLISSPSCPLGWMNVTG